MNSTSGSVTKTLYAFSFVFMDRTYFYVLPKNIQFR